MKAKLLRDLEPIWYDGWEKGFANAIEKCEKVIDEFETRCTCNICNREMIGIDELKARLAELKEVGK